MSIVALCVAAAAAGCGSSGGPADVHTTGAAAGGGATSGSASTGATANTIIPNTKGVSTAINVDGLRDWTGDVARQDSTTLQEKCWTYPPQYIEERYLGPGTETIAAVLSGTPYESEAGVGWDGGDGIGIFAPWSEAQSPYVCPEVTLPGDDGAPDSLAAFRVKRYILREQGRPVHPHDNADDYPLLCDPHGPVAGGGTADPGSITVRRTGSDWEVTAGNTAFQVEDSPSGPCIFSISGG